MKSKQKYQKAVLKVYFFKMYVYVYMPEFIRTTRVPEESVRSPGSGVIEQLRAAKCMLGTKPGSVARALSALNY